MSCTAASRVTANAKGLIPGFRVWELKAYNSSGDVVAEVSEDMGENNKKFKAFILKVAEAGYYLTAEQANYISDQLLLRLPQVDNTYLRASVQELVGNAASAAAVGAFALTGPGAIVGGVTAGAAAKALLGQLGI